MKVNIKVKHISKYKYARRLVLKLAIKSELTLLWEVSRLFHYFLLMLTMYQYENVLYLYLLKFILLISCNKPYIIYK